MPARWKTKTLMKKGKYMLPCGLQVPGENSLACGVAVGAGLGTGVNQHMDRCVHTNSWSSSSYSTMQHQLGYPQYLSTVLSTPTAPPRHCYHVGTLQFNP